MLEFAMKHDEVASFDLPSLCEASVDLLLEVGKITPLIVSYIPGQDAGVVRNATMSLFPDAQFFHIMDCIYLAAENLMRCSDMKIDYKLEAIRLITTLRSSGYRVVDALDNEVSESDAIVKLLAFSIDCHNTIIRLQCYPK